MGGVGSANSDQDILKIMQDMKNNRSMQFVDKKVIMQELRGRLPEGEIEKALDKLQNDGMIYSTMNENVFALTE